MVLVRVFIAQRVNCKRNACWDGGIGDQPAAATHALKVCNACRDRPPGREDGRRGLGGGAVGLGIGSGGGGGWVGIATGTPMRQHDEMQGVSTVKELHYSHFHLLISLTSSSIECPPLIARALPACGADLMACLPARSTACMATS